MAAASTARGCAVLCWGNTADGQLGLGGIEEEQIAEPRLLPAMRDRQLRAVACGDKHTLFAMSDGSLYTCGNGDCGQLGHARPRKRPEPVSAFELYVIHQVACGSLHSVALSHSGLVFCWGDDQYGQLGEDTPEGAPVSSDVPRLTKSISDLRVIQIVCGNHHTLALTDDGCLYGWGSNSCGQLGVGLSSGVCRKPQIISSILTLAIVHIAAGSEHSFALSISGALFGWGKNSFGQLGVGDDTDRSSPTLCSTLRSQKVKFVACGENHTAVLTKDGGVFTFGAGMYGQLGHNATGVELLPKKVFELMGSIVSQIACGRQHTVALIAQTGRLYSFGLGGNGQLGVGRCENCLSPSVVSGPFVAPCPVARPADTDYVVRRVVAGGDQTFVLATAAATCVQPDDFRLVDSQCTVHELSIQQLDGLAAMDVSNKLPPSNFIKDLQKVYSSAACINSSFLLSDDRHYDCSSKHHGIDLDLAKTYFTKMADLPNALQCPIDEAITHQLLPLLSSSPPDAEALRLYLTLPWLQLTDPARMQHFCMTLGHSVLRLAVKPTRVLVCWLRSLPSQHFLRHIQIYKQTVAHILCRGVPTNDCDIITGHRCVQYCMDLLSLLNSVNEMNGQVVTYSAFYIPELTDKINIRDEYIHWIQQSITASQTLNFCNYPFVFDAEAKTVLLQTDALIQMQVAVDEVSRRNFTSLFLPTVEPDDPMLELLVTRDDLVRNTVDQLAKQARANLKKPLKVTFIGEEALDAGGVRKEFFMLLLKEILDPKYGMFHYYEESRLLWFTEQTFEDDVMFSLIGVLCGLAIYNSTIVDISFPLVLYKKLLKRPVTLDDLKELQPTVGKSLHELLRYEADDVEEVFCLDFQVCRDAYGELKQYELIPNGANVPVCNENRQQYVDAYLNYTFNESVKGQFQAFYEGFHKVCGGRVLELFHPKELQAMIVGTEDYDWLELEKNAKYQGVFSADHKTITMFWTVFHSMSEEDKKKFLRYLTGTDRIPIRGMKSIQMVVQSTATSEEFLPVAHTCFNLLDLPVYSTLAKLRLKLLTAIQHTEGFGLV